MSDWIWKRRLDKSRRDLADSLRACDSIAQIALTCGFADFGHFSRRYKEAFGASPREDRVRLRTGASDAFPLMRSPCADIHDGQEHDTLQLKVGCIER